jgi:hypothetical protein
MGRIIEGAGSECTEGREGAAEREEKVKKMLLVKLVLNINT